MLLDKKTTLKELQQYSALYTRYNTSKVEYLRNYIPEKKRDVFGLIPFLLHEENPDPAERSFCVCTVAGISDFSYTPDLKKLLKRNLISFHAARTEDKALIRLFYHIGERWGWGRRQIDECAGFLDGDFAKREVQKKMVVGFLVGAYNRIRERTKDSKAMISSRDLTVIGNKLKSILAPGEKKIPYEYSLFMAKDISVIEIEDVSAPQKAPAWQVAIWIKGATGNYPQILRRIYNPVIACAWCSLNRFYTGKEKVIISSVSSLPAAEIINLMTMCNLFFPHDEADKLKIKDLLEPLYITHLYVMPNREDPDFNSSVDSLIVFYKNNIGEMFYTTHKGPGWESWLKTEIFEKTVGLRQAPGLNWSVHVFKGATTSTRRVSTIITQFIRGIIEECS